MTISTFMSVCASQVLLEDVTFLFVCLMDTFPKEKSRYLIIRDFAGAGIDGNVPFQVNPWNKTNVPTFLGKVNLNTAAVGN